MVEFLPLIPWTAINTLKHSFCPPTWGLVPRMSQKSHDLIVLLTATHHMIKLPWLFLTRPHLIIERGVNVVIALAVTERRGVHIHSHMFVHKTLLYYDNAHNTYSPQKYSFPLLKMCQTYVWDACECVLKLVVDTSTVNRYFVSLLTYTTPCHRFLAICTPPQATPLKRTLS